MHLKSWQNHIRTSNFLLVALTTILLLFVACGPAIQWFLFSSHTASVDYQKPAKPQKATGTAQEDNSQEQDHTVTKISAVSEAVLPVYKFQIAFCCSFVREFCFEKKSIPNEIFSFPLPQSHYFRTLFRRIISPNAP